MNFKWSCLHISVHLKNHIPTGEFDKLIFANCQHCNQCSLLDFIGWTNSTKFDKIGVILGPKLLALAKTWLNYQEKASFYSFSQNLLSQFFKVLDQFCNKEGTLILMICWKYPE